MKMLYFSVTLMVALVAATAYLAMQARDEAVKANAKMDLMTRQQKAIAAQESAEVQLPPPAPAPAPTPAPVVVQAPAPKPVPAPVSRPAGSPTPPPTKAAEPTKAPEAPKVASAPPASLAAPKAAGTPAVVDGPVPTPGEAPLTPAQRLVKAAPSIGKVKEFVPDQGFVVLGVGTKQGVTQGASFDLRRDASIVGRIKITGADENEAVADLDYKSVPAGVTVRAGDELIGVVLQR